MSSTATGAHGAEGGVHSGEGAPLITFENVALGYGGKPVLSDLTFCLHSGGYLGIVGPNAAGKTTLLRAILGLNRPLSGAITFHKHPVAFGYVPQAQTSDDHFPLTALEIVLMGRYRAIGFVRRPGRADRDRALRALEQVGLADDAKRLFREMSGGQKQRVLIARALVAEPDILALDEPTTGLDVSAEHAVLNLVHSLHAERKLLVLMVSHALNVVANRVEHVLMLGSGRFKMGRVDDVVQPEILAELYGLPLEVIQVGERRLVL